MDEGANRRIDLRIDVTGAVAVTGAAHIAVTVHLPRAECLAKPPVVLFASPGGGYARGYYDLRFDSHGGYSQAEYHTARGTIFVAYDHLGVGDSSTQQCDALSVEMLADGNDVMVQQILAKLAAGITTGFPPVIEPFTVGIGQSLGGGVTIVMQGRRRTFDAVGLLGISAIHTQLPQATQRAAGRARSAFQFTRATPLRDLSVARTAAEVLDFKYPFHWEDTPSDILDTDLEGGYPLRKTAPPFGSMTVPVCAVAMMSAGYFTPEASCIDVPVFIGLGERDVCPDPWQEPSAYPSSNDVSLYVVQRMAHMHNFASTRERLWCRLEQWSQLVAAGDG